MMVDMLKHKKSVSQVKWLQMQLVSLPSIIQLIRQIYFQTPFPVKARKKSIGFLVLIMKGYIEH